MQPLPSQDRRWQPSRWHLLPAAVRADRHGDAVAAVAWSLHRLRHRSAEESVGRHRGSDRGAIDSHDRLEQWPLVWAHVAGDLTAIVEWQGDS